MPVKVAATPPAAATGMKKRRVEPDSLQLSSAALLPNKFVPSTYMVLPSTVISAPNALAQSMVAKISWDISTGDITLLPLASDAQSIAR